MTGEILTDCDMQKDGESDDGAAKHVSSTFTDFIEDNDDEAGPSTSQNDCEFPVTRFAMLIGYLVNQIDLKSILRRS